MALPEFTHQLRLPLHVLSTVVGALQERSLVQLSGDDPPLLLLARDPSTISVTQVLDAVRSAGEDRFFSPEELPAPTSVDQVINQMRAALEAATDPISLRDLAAEALSSDTLAPPNTLAEPKPHS